MVATPICPAFTNTSATAPLPLPDKVTRFTPPNDLDPVDGVYPIPGFETSIAFAAAANPTKSPLAWVPNWKNVFPISYPVSPVVVPSPTLIFLELRISESGMSLGIIPLPFVSSGL